MEIRDAVKNNMPVRSNGDALRNFAEHSARACPTSPLGVKSKLMHRNKKGDLFDHLSAHACAGSFGQPRLPKALNQ